MTDSSIQVWSRAHTGETLRFLSGNKNNESQVRIKAKKSFENALRDDPNNMWAIGRLGVTYRQLDNLDKAIDQFTIFQKNSPGDPWVYAQLGETYRLKLVKESTDPSDPFAVKAIEFFEKAIDLYDDSLDYYWALAHLGATYFHIEQYDEALSKLKQAFNGTKQSYAWAAAYIGATYLRQENPEEANDYWDIAQRLDRRVVPDPNLSLGMLAYYNKEFDRAIRLFNQKKQEEPNNAVALYSIAVATIGKKGVSGAQAEIDQANTALKQQSNSATNYMLAALEYHQGKTDQTSKYIQSAITATDEIQDILRSNNVSESMTRVLTDVQSNNLSWLGLEFDKGFQSLISRAVKA
ncbi:MAG: hypothetical protein F6K31_23240 [Symploca sp. SIO2G7]|nr:hypothetical protein [Symploca sp. SIO2G7]